jgi:hypothetical protein
MRARRLSCAGQEHTIACVFLRAIDPSGHLPFRPARPGSRTTAIGENDNRFGCFWHGCAISGTLSPARIFLPISFATELAVKRARAGTRGVLSRLRDNQLLPALRRASRPADFCWLGLA